MKKLLAATSLLLFFAAKPIIWGFFAHQRINKLAVFTLPPEMMPFYKKNINYLMDASVNPDKRRYAVKDEAPRHFIDIDAYGDSALFKLPYFWKDAIEKFPEDSLMKHGIVPWHIQRMKFALTEAFKMKDTKKILRLSAEIGHYIGDANVPLHTTRNYNGQLTKQEGIHGLWESRLAELFSDNFDFFVGKAEYQQFPAKTIWKAIAQANACVDSVLSFEKKLTQTMGDGRKYSIEERNNQSVKTYSQEFSKEYNKMLNQQVERQMRASIKMVGDFWFTCWVDAGQPDLTPLLTYKDSDNDKNDDEQEKKSWLRRFFEARGED